MLRICNIICTCDDRYDTVMK